MYGGKIFLRSNQVGQLIALEETPYAQETELQELLVEYPDLIPGDQINPENPRRWLLVKREMGVPGDVTETGRWSLDHLFLDQDGIPTFVECKRSSDTRGRREVVAQMLDYAANGISYWSMERIRQDAAETAKARGTELDTLLSELLALPEGDIETIEAYWRTVERNLQEHRVRLVFVADRTPRELRRLVEFLNEELRNVEVLAVEVKQFQDAPGSTTPIALVPRVVGLTERPPPPRPPTLTTTPERFLAACTADARPFFEKVWNYAQQAHHQIYWGVKGFSCRAPTQDGGVATYFYGYPPDTFQIYISPQWNTPASVEANLRSELMALGPFQESGKYTLTSKLTLESVKQLTESFGVLIELIEQELLVPPAAQQTHAE
jgi:hypothetical protein